MFRWSVPVACSSRAKNYHLAISKRQEFAAVFLRTPYIGSALLLSALLQVGIRFFAEHLVQ